MDLGWKADVCKHQKHHANYGAHCDAQVNLAQVSTDADEELEVETEQFGKGDKFQAALEKAQ